VDGSFAGRPEKRCIREASESSTEGCDPAGRANVSRQDLGFAASFFATAATFAALALALSLSNWGWQPAQQK
jgi:hypothetical protein